MNLNLNHTPVILPAYQEGDHISTTLDKLTEIRDYVSPIVVENGDPDGKTEAAAKNYGATYLHNEGRSKIFAIQTGMEKLGSAALKPFFMLDADARPVDPKAWYEAQMREATESKTPFVGSIPKEFMPRPTRMEENPRLESRYAKLLTFGQHAISVADNALVMPHVKDNPFAISQSGFGVDQIYNIKDQSIVDEIIDLPKNLWYGEDLEMVNIVRRAGKYKYITNWMARVATEISGHFPDTLHEQLWSMITNPAQIENSYKAGFPAGSVVSAYDLHNQRTSSN